MALKIMTCLRCKHEWASKNADAVRVCPRCKSPYWDRERKIKKIDKENNEKNN